MKKFLMLGLGAVAFAATPAAAQPAHAKGKAKHSQVQPYGSNYGQQARHCPPGLAKKNPQCMPPGQYKKLYDVGHRFPTNYDRWTPYNQIPSDYRRRYDLDPRSRYIYDQNYIYRVDPTTMVVREVLRAIL
ncbi:hypothetical protein [Sphingomicrobium clamense]|uniref:Regulator RcnB of Ni and Co efflux n=1 Tax=Sphingomicrobium clamense TaxID=2851013 RepID=A0ABS6V4E5_9SPHN|nr:hypothetical protein [Sphingomicrobium sp. B8]MBW0144435.1 hypothetical protein [Sphingomicrobium sp. B8]